MDVRLGETDVAGWMTEQIWHSLALPPVALDRLAIGGSGDLPSAFPVTDLAASAIGAAALAVSELAAMVGDAPAVSVDRRLASLWFGLSIRPIGWALPPPWDPIAGDYRTNDGWLRLHTNASHHRRAALAVLDCPPDSAAVARAVETWEGDDLEAAVVDAGGCAAVMRTVDDWRGHPQGQAVSAEPLIACDFAEGPPSPWQPTPARPLAGLRVLDLTRVLAGPVATRFLAGYGAEVLRIDPPDWDEPGVVPEVTLGKRCARLDLRSPDDRAIFERLLGEADIFVHGYRPGALDALGYDPERRRAIRPGLIDVSLDAYGWSGPWRERRGFDSLVQMSAGIAAAGMAWRQADRPTPLPVQALDHATGYLVAAAVVRGLIGRLASGAALTARLSLARTACLLIDAQGEGTNADWAPSVDADYVPTEEATDWGPARRVWAPAVVVGAPLAWNRGATALRSAQPVW